MNRNGRISSINLSPHTHCVALPAQFSLLRSILSSRLVSSYNSSFSFLQHSTQECSPPDFFCKIHTLLGTILLSLSLSFSANVSMFLTQIWFLFLGFCIFSVTKIGLFLVSQLIGYMSMLIDYLDILHILY